MATDFEYDIQRDTIWDMDMFLKSLNLGYLREANSSNFFPSSATLGNVI